MHIVGAVKLLAEFLEGIDVLFQNMEAEGSPLLLFMRNVLRPSMSKRNRIKYFNLMALSVVHWG